MIKPCEACRVYAAQLAHGLESRIVHCTCGTCPLYTHPLPPWTTQIMLTSGWPVEKARKST